MQLKALAIVCATIAALACSSSGSAPSASSGTARRGSANLITEQEIQSLGAGAETALDIVERLRPAMLRTRPSTFGNSQSESARESTNVKAYVDEISLGDASNLRGVPAVQVKEIRYLSATDATQRWGTGFGSGVIQVITKK